MKTEIWKDVIGYKGLYQVSNLGRVKSFRRNKEIILKPSIGDRGYYVVTLYNKRKIHQLVAESFLNHTPKGMSLVVDHINNNKLDNRVENLQIITQRENLIKDKSCSSKYAGVSWFKLRNKWRASISKNGKKIHLGLFTNEYDAALSYQQALKQI